MSFPPPHAILAAFVVLAAALGAAHAQAEPPGPLESCGYVSSGGVSSSNLSSRDVADEEPRSGCFRDLCRAVLIAVHGTDGAPDPLELTAEEAEAALARAEPPLVYALPFELRADIDYVLGPVVWIGSEARWAAAHAAGRPEAGDLGAWLFHALVQAEAWGVDGATIEGGLGGDTGERFLAYESRLTAQLGVPPDALRAMIAAVGHHGEIYGRWFEPAPGPNRPVELGGQLYAPPVSSE